MAIWITILEEYDPAPRNSLCLFDRMGELMYTYAKVHRFSTYQQTHPIFRTATRRLSW